MPMCQDIAIDIPKRWKARVIRTFLSPIVTDINIIFHQRLYMARVAHLSKIRIVVF